MTDLTVSGANTKLRPLLPMTHFLYSILPLCSEGLSLSAEMAFPGNVGPGHRVGINPFGPVSWSCIPALFSH